MAIYLRLLDLGPFVLDRLELFTDEKAHTLSHHLERLCAMRLVVFPASHPKLLTENCMYMGGY